MEEGNWPRVDEQNRTRTKQMVVEECFCCICLIWYFKINIRKYLQTFLLLLMSGTYLHSSKHTYLVLLQLSVANKWHHDDLETMKVIERDIIWLVGFFYSKHSNIMAFVHIVLYGKVSVHGIHLISIEG